MNNEKQLINKTGHFEGSDQRERREISLELLTCCLGDASATVGMTLLFPSFRTEAKVEVEKSPEYKGISPCVTSISIAVT